MELERYFASVEFRAADARAEVSRIVAESGGKLVLASIPLPGQPSYLTGPFVPLSSHQHHPMMPPPPLSTDPHDIIQADHLRWVFPPATLSFSSSSPNTVNPRVRPRTGSMDAVNAPAVKRSPGDSNGRSSDERAMFNESVRHVLPLLL
jgi:hypothetical protein